MRVAILQIRQMAEAYFFDTLNVLHAGDLRRRGHDVRVFAHNTAEAESDDEAFGGLRERLERFGPEVIVFERLYRADLVDLVRTSTVQHVGVLHQGSALRHPGVDFVIPQRDRAPLIEAIDQLEQGDASVLGTVAGVTSHFGDNLLDAKPSVDRLFSDFDLAYDLLEVVRPSPAPGPVRKHVFGNLGCPYRKAPNPTGFLADVELPEGVIERGCTFCDRAAYDRIPPSRALERIRDQLRQVRAATPDLEQLILVDEYALRYVDQFADLLLDEGCPDIEIFFSARIDYIMKFEERFVRALEKTAGSLKLVMYLVGIENFSPMELWRFNKGLSVRQCIEGLDKLDSLLERFPHFRTEPSFGFILFTPWTTPLDLYFNLAYLRRLDFDRWRSSAALTRLRLYPENALYYRAIQDGLIVDNETAGADASDRYGYEAEVPWEFQDARVRKIYEEVFQSATGSDGVAALERGVRPYLRDIQQLVRAHDFEDYDVVKRAVSGDLRV